MNTNRLQQLLRFGMSPNNPAVQQQYQTLRDQDYPLDDPVMLQANPGLAEILAQAAMPAMPNSPVQPQGQAQSFDLGQLLQWAQLPPVQAPQPASPSPYQFSNTFGNLGQMLLGNAPAAPATATPVVPTPDVAMQSQQQLPPTPEQRPQAQMQAPAVSAPQMQLPPTPTGTPDLGQALGATPDQILLDLVGQPQPQAQAQERSFMDKLSSPEFLTYLQDVLMGIASESNWGQGIVSGIRQNEGRAVAANQAETNNLLLQSKLGLNQSEMNRNNASAADSVASASTRGANAKLESEKTVAETARIRAQTLLAEAQTKAAGNPDGMNTKEYARLYTDLRKAFADSDVLLPQGSEDTLFSPDFRAREALNKTGDARIVPLTGETDRLLTQSKEQFQAGTLSEEEFASRLQRAMAVHGSEAIRKYLQ